MTNAEVSDGQGVAADILHQAQQLGQKAVCIWHEGQHALARDLLRSAISIHPDVPVQHANLAMMLKDAAPIEDRVHHYRRAIELDPTVPMWYAKLKGPCPFCVSFIENWPTDLLDCAGAATK